MTSPVERARGAFDRHAWREAVEAYAAAGDLSRDAEDQQRLAIAAYLVGEDERSVEAWEAAHRLARDAGDAATAARCAAWLAMSLLFGGQTARARGWLGRAERIVTDAGLECPATGYLLIPQVLDALAAGEATAAHDLALRAAGLGEQFGDPDLRALGGLGHGQALLALGDTKAGTARLDEVMVAVATGEVGPVVAGIVYCAVILECMRLFDLQRAAEWTQALSDWCDTQPDLVPYRGQCLVHRSQLQQAAGDWPEAVTTVEAACRRLTDPPHPALGLAHYQQAELHRLTGELDQAEARYREASRHGHHPMPGLALLELARGETQAAAASIRRALQETGDLVDRPALLAAAVETRRATGDLPGARAAAHELAAIATTRSSEVLAAMAAQATGMVLIAEGEPAAALPELRAAASAWRHLHMPYEAARVAVLLGLACSALGDRTSAALELDTARQTFAELGAAPDLDRLDRLTAELDAGGGSAGAGGIAGGRRASLSAREREVLGHVAAGRTNREIATELVISQHTVGRHLENIFAKLGVSSRAAAIAYAYEHDLL